MSEIDSTQAAGQSSGVVLTLKGERYCEAQRQALIRKEAEEIIEGCLDLVERMLRVLDRLDPDPDLEPMGDELDQSFPEGGRGSGTVGAHPHEDDEDDDPGEDDDPAGGDVLDEPHDPEEDCGADVDEPIFAVRKVRND